ncbi:MAG: preprotein translocase subunit SecG [Xanthomonadales bacterium]|jgi:preprotein translocase subunit SecG|nr:preprotein translocase subunit SecG [Xanthomonadales bacterium]
MQVLNIFHVLIAIALIAFVLIQRGQGATAGAAFGSGASGTVFGARGAGNFLTRSTWVLAALFCAISLTMAVMVSRIMTESPAADLGVVTAVEPAVPEETGQSAQELSLSSDETGPADMPVFEPADDMPAVGTGSEEAVDRAIGEDLPSAEGDDQPTADDS